MTDEKFEFIKDCREKKHTARSARNARTHCGKGGAVKFPSDSMTKKEREAMNGKCVSYRMNSPIAWEEFKTWPKEHQETYIKLLRKKYGVPDKYIAEMMGVNRPQFCKLIVSIGLGQGKSAGGTLRSGKWDQEGFYAWCGRVKASNAPIEVPLVEIRDEVEVVTPEMENKLHELVKDDLMSVNPELAKSFENSSAVNVPEEDADHFLEEIEELKEELDAVKAEFEEVTNGAYNDTRGNCKSIKDSLKQFAIDCEKKPEMYMPYRPHGGVYDIPVMVENSTCESKTVIPERGEMTLQGNVDDILRTISKLLDGRQVRLEVEWEVLG